MLIGCSNSMNSFTIHSLILHELLIRRRDGGGGAELRLQSVSVIKLPHAKGAAISACSFRLFGVQTAVGVEENPGFSEDTVSIIHIHIYSIQLNYSCELLMMDNQDGGQCQTHVAMAAKCGVVRQPCDYRRREEDDALFFTDRIYLQI